MNDGRKQFCCNAKLLYFSIYNWNSHWHTTIIRVAICSYSLWILEGYNLVTIEILTKYKDGITTVHNIVANLVRRLLLQVPHFLRLGIP